MADALLALRDSLEIRTVALPIFLACDAMSWHAAPAAV